MKKPTASVTASKVLLAADTEMMIYFQKKKAQLKGQSGFDKFRRQKVMEYNSAGTS